ncbi:class I SAM-dependent methyltransferase [Streptomyces roseirectus]|uniref:Class I SAM-dependent methyltransferase n=1 Tax=Streptomyces roseirectus TaxID=2768066 RepID=A0A7H0ICR0_9ACTN|nr:class I SAM-dependent methyltransferase [Streptomyces roseirectus]QNP70576.1 class I SAM-dependent methyltransferase [Streptomyces roseirectus]
MALTTPKSIRMSAQHDRVVTVDDTLRAATAHRLTAAGTALLWRGDYVNARQLLAALARRIPNSAYDTASSPAEIYARQRDDRARRALLLNRLLVELDADHALNLRRAPDVRAACRAAYGPPDGARLVPLRELLGVLGAFQWQLRGVEVPALGARIHPAYGVFSPVRGEYVDLVDSAPLPRSCRTAFDLGTGTGVLAAVLARRGVERVVATDVNPRALACARDNVRRLGFGERVVVQGPGLYPRGRADLVVCNPPWLPGRPSAGLELGVYDEDSVMLREFLAGLGERLRPGGEGWLVLSDLAELLGLRTRKELTGLFRRGGLRVVGRLDARPRHRRSRDRSDPLHAVRSAEVTSLWRLAIRE